MKLLVWKLNSFCTMNIVKIVRNSIRVYIFFCLLIIQSSISYGAIKCNSIFDTDLTTKLMIEHRQLFESLIYTSGFRSFEDYTKTIGNDPILSEALSEIQSMKNLAVAIRVNFDSFKNILKSENILNQFQTNTSAGQYSPIIRNSIESNLLKIPLSKYEKYPLQFKPKYGYLAELPKSKFADPKKVIGYGDIVLYLKENQLSDRMTITKLDSFKLVPLIYQMWDNIAIPWKYRAMLIPFLANRLIHERVVSNHFLEMGSVNHKFIFGQNYGNNSYIEIQIWGELTLNDIKAVGFYGEKPDLETLKSLEELGIEVVF